MTRILQQLNLYPASGHGSVLVPLCVLWNGAAVNHGIYYSTLSITVPTFRPSTCLHVLSVFLLSRWDLCLVWRRKWHFYLATGSSIELDRRVQEFEASTQVGHPNPRAGSIEMAGRTMRTPPYQWMFTPWIHFRQPDDRVVPTSRWFCLDSTEAQELYFDSIARRLDL